MKKMVIFFLILLILAGSVTTAYCGSPVTKLKRGAANLTTWPLECFHRMNLAYERGGVTEAATYGLLEGIWMMGLRAAVGFWEVATFPFALPEDYAPILTDPEYFIPPAAEKQNTKG